MFTWFIELFYFKSSREFEFSWQDTHKLVTPVVEFVAWWYLWSSVVTFLERFLVSVIFLIHNYVDFWDWLATLGVRFGCSAGRDDGWGSVPGKYRERIPHASADPVGDHVTLWGHADVPGNVPECCCFDWPACWSVSTGVLYAGGPSRPHDALLPQYSKLLKEWWWFPWQCHLLFLEASQVYLENSIWWEKEK